MPELTRPDAILHYEVAGSGRPLLLIAGIASDSASWGLLPSLLPGRHLLMPDNRGSGRTRCDGALSIADMVDDLAALIEHLGIGPVDVVGHSMGGFLGLALAARHPEKVSRLVTLASGTLSNASRLLFRDLSRLYFTIPPVDWFRLLYQWLFSEPFFASETGVAAAAASSVAYPYRQSPGDFARQVAAIDAMTPIDLSSINCPVLAIAAERDLLAPPESVRALHKSITDCRFETIPGVAHSIHWEAPQAVGALVATFLD